MSKGRKTQLKTIMWRLLRARKVITYDDLQELTGASRSYAQEWMSGLIKKGFARKISWGRYMLDEEAYLKDARGKADLQDGEMVEEIEDGAHEKGQAPATNTLAPGQTQQSSRKERPEYRVWAAMKDLKRFTFYDLAGLNLAGDTLIRQYLTLLKRAGILSTELRNEQKDGEPYGRYIKVYTMTEKAGGEAPVVGRCFYVFDPNTGEYHTTDLMTFESESQPQNEPSSFQGRAKDEQ